MFNYNHLYYFYVTAKLGGVSSASKHLNISQPSLSAQIKTFEGSVSHKLFEKNGRRMQLTRQGEQVYAYCQQIFDIAGHLSEHLKSPDQKEKRRIHIGVSEQIERPFIADTLGNILQQGKEHLNCTLTISSGEEEELIQKLKTKRIDLFLSNTFANFDDLHEIVALKMPVALVISKSLLKKLGYRQLPTLSEVFKNEKIGLFIPSQNLRLRHEGDIFMQQKNLKKPVLMESEILSVIARAVVDDGGCAFLPVPYIVNEIKLGLVKVIGPQSGYWQHHLSLVSRKQIKYDPLFDEIKNNLIALNKAV
ncbi:LysR family transcriptional regulator [Bdellovibrio sp. HCB337]|uniref:LysR family transcriptional regulator n=1 Tax=Bdellovibrio sp. HCB337 TaxID=3394358 RepID=UPI0039A4473C